MKDFLKPTFNHDFLWNKIYDYVDYSKLCDEMKKVVDSLYSTLYDGLSRSKESYSSESTVYELKNINLIDLKNKYGYWLIDTDMKLVFSFIYGQHRTVRPCLVALKLIKKGYKFNLNDINFVQKMEELSDIYTALLQGVFLSGANATMNTSSYEPIIVGKTFFSKHPDLQRLSHLFPVDEIFYPYEDAISDLNKIFNL